MPGQRPDNAANGKQKAEANTDRHNEKKDVGVLRIRKGGAGPVVKVYARQGKWGAVDERIRTLFIKKR